MISKLKSVSIFIGGAAILTALPIFYGIRTTSNAQEFSVRDQILESIPASHLGIFKTPAGSRLIQIRVKDLESLNADMPEQKFYVRVGRNGVNPKDKKENKYLIRYDEGYPALTAEDQPIWAELESADPLHQEINWYDSAALVRYQKSIQLQDVKLELWLMGIASTDREWKRAESRIKELEYELSFGVSDKDLAKEMKAEMAELKDLELQVQLAGLLKIQSEQGLDSFYLVSGVQIDKEIRLSSVSPLPGASLGSADQNFQEFGEAVFSENQTEKEVRPMALAAKSSLDSLRFSKKDIRYEWQDDTGLSFILQISESDAGDYKVVGPIRPRLIAQNNGHKLDSIWIGFSFEWVFEGLELPEGAGKASVMSILYYHPDRIVEGYACQFPEDYTLSFAGAHLPNGNSVYVRPNFNEGGELRYIDLLASQAEKRTRSHVFWNLSEETDDFPLESIDRIKWYTMEDVSNDTTLAPVK